MIPEKPRRLDQILSRYGYCSRSEGAAWIRAGRVSVRGAPAVATDDRALPSEVLIDSQPVEAPGGLLALFHKPAGCVCSHSGRDGPTIYDLLPARWPLRHPPVTSVGRLDRDTTGLLLLTDDGALVQRWTSPRHKVPKVYEVTVDADLRPELITLFASGTLPLDGEDKPCLPAKLEILSAREARLELIEGRFHQVKRMFASQGLNVTRLHRSRFGQFDLGDLQPGQWRLLPLPVPTVRDGGGAGVSPAISGAAVSAVSAGVSPANTFAGGTPAQAGETLAPLQRQRNDTPVSP